MRPTGSAIWVVGGEDPDCSHGSSTLEAVGSDGVNTYYRCTRCGATVVFADGATLSAALE